MRLRVLHIIWSSNTGGIERLVLSLWKEQQRDNIVDAEVYAGQPNGSLWAEFKQTGKVHAGPFKGGMDFNIEKIRSVKTLFSDFDILHFHSFHPATAYAARNSGKKIVYSEHGNFGFGRNLTIADKINRLLLKKFLNNNCHYITFNSRFSKETAEKRYLLTGVRKSVVYNGISPDEALFNEPADTDIQEFCKEHFTIGYIGRLATVKRIDRLISVCAQLQKTADFRLVIIGDGPLEQELRTLVQKENLASKVLFAGRRSQVRRFYRHFNVFILPSANEAFGLVVTEAMFAGTPVLIFNDAGGPVELVHPADPENICSNEIAMVNRLSTMIIQKEPEVKKTHRRSIAEKFDIQSMNQSFKNIYLSL